MSCWFHDISQSHVHFIKHFFR